MPRRRGALRHPDRRPRAGLPLGAGGPEFSLSAPKAVWDKVLQPIPPRHHHSIFALRMRVPEFVLGGDELAFIQHCRPARRLLEIGRWIRAGNAGPTPASLRPALAEPRPPRSPAATSPSMPMAPTGGSMPRAPAPAATCSACIPPAPMAASSTG
ncbi:hypothetical protein ACFQY5_07410 [Paeniroseomonas aquatica]|uniref:hypothetical protein n=1 Tax=Paeniroseomonas aquatica TaxID=373043 RepID=UPI00362442FD